MELKLAAILLLLLAAAAFRLGLCGCRYRSPVWRASAVETAPNVTRSEDGGAYSAAAVAEELTGPDDRGRWV